MLILKGIRRVSTLGKHPTSFQVPLVITESSPKFDPDFRKTSSVSEVFLPSESPSVTVSALPSFKDDFEEEIDNFGNLEVSETEESGKKEKAEIVEENRSDGHAPIRSAKSILMQSLQRSSSMTTSLSDIDVTLFNFHSTEFAESLLKRNISSMVIVESSHVFSKNAKKFAEKLPNVAAYRADIYTLMGVGRKKTAKFPKKMMLADLGKRLIDENNEKIHPLTLVSSEGKSAHDEYYRSMKFRRPHLLAVLPTPNIQKTVLDSLIQHALLHHSGIDKDTVFRYGNTNLLTFLGSGILSQYTCSTDERLHFLSHQHRRHSALFNKLFQLEHLRTRPDSEIPHGFPPSLFQPELPTAKKITHEKKLAEVNLMNKLQYSVQISPRIHVNIAGNEVTTENEMGKSLVEYACFMTLIGRQSNAKAVQQVVNTLWPESALSIPSDIIGEHKIGQLPLDHLEQIFPHVQEELRSTSIAQSYYNELKIKRDLK